MDTDLMYDTPYAQIYLRENIPALHLRWIGFATSREFREACEATLRILVARKLDRMIADNREAKAIAPEDREWLSGDWFPRAIAAGFRKSAVLLSESTLNQYTSNSVSEQVSGPDFSVQNFTVLDDAIAWLLGP